MRRKLKISVRDLNKVMVPVGLEDILLVGLKIIGIELQAPNWIIITRAACRFQKKVFLIGGRLHKENAPGHKILRKGTKIEL